MSEAKDIQAAMKWYKRETGLAEIDPDAAALWMFGKGYKFPDPPTAKEIMARKISRALREETRTDDRTGFPYRANHAYPIHMPDGGIQWSWIDIDEAAREPMRKSLVARREQMVGDALQLSFDQDHWNAMHPNEPPITMPLDFSDDVEWRKNSRSNEQAAS